MKRLEKTVISEKRRGSFVFVGHHLCLDFINTQKIASGKPLDLLPNFQALLTWFAAVELLSEVKKKQSLEKWGETKAGAVVFQEALRLRTACREITQALTEKRDVLESSISTLNLLSSKMQGYAQIVSGQKSFETHFFLDPKKAMYLLYPLVEAAIELVCTLDPVLVKQCENAPCILFFYDTTKNHRRRWCSTRGCGNRAKVAAFYRRRKEKGQG